jgi:multiple sugar transport system permease protein
MMVTGDIFPYGRMFAASLLMALPVIVLAAIGQRAMVSGLTVGAVKGRGERGTRKSDGE